jgi:hypothetical protein
MSLVSRASAIASFAAVLALQRQAIVRLADLEQHRGPQRVLLDGVAHIRLREPTPGLREHEVDGQNLQVHLVLLP